MKRASLLHEDGKHSALLKPQSSSRGVKYIGEAVAMQNQALAIEASN